MTYVALVFANYAFFVLHAGLIVFSMVGWAFRRTRVLQAIAMAATAFSWFVIGPLRYGYEGIGLCLCTEYHHHVRAALELPSELNYLQMLAMKILGLDLTVPQSETLALSIFGLTLVAMICTWSYVGYCKWCGPASAELPVARSESEEVTSSPAVPSPGSTSP